MGNPSNPHRRPRRHPAHSGHAGVYRLFLLGLLFCHAAAGQSQDAVEPESRLTPWQMQSQEPTSYRAIVPRVLSPLTRSVATEHEAFYHRPKLVTPVIYTSAWHGVAMAALLSMDREATGFQPVRPGNVIRAFTKPPVWDDDDWYTNYVGHPAWGSETYLSVRRYGYSRIESFAFSTAASVVWEYLVESWAEQPSIQDLLFTSTIGSILGEARYHLIKYLVRPDAWWSELLLVLVDPLRGITNLVGMPLHVGVIGG